MSSSKPKKTKLPDVWVVFDAFGNPAEVARLKSDIFRAISNRYVPYQKPKTRATCAWKWVSDPNGGPEGYYRTECDSFTDDAYGVHCHDCGGKIKR